MLLTSTNWLTEKTCPYHDFLAEQWLIPGDAVISFNYDLIMDHSLDRLANWVVEDGYGIPLQRKDGAQGREYETSEVKLLKLHGSLNWYRFTATKRTDNSSVSARVDKQQRNILITPIQQAQSGLFTPGYGIIPPKYGPFVSRRALEEYQREGSPQMFVFGEFLRRCNPYKEGWLPLMIMPTPYKPFEELKFGELKQMWRLARKAIQSSDEVFSCGFSFRDRHFVQLVRESSLVRKDPIMLNVITKDPGEIRSIKGHFRKANVEVVHYVDGWLSDFVKNLGYMEA